MLTRSLKMVLPCVRGLVSTVDLTTDQRGVPRPYGGRCDYGAFEATGNGITLLGNGGFETAKMITYPASIETQGDGWDSKYLKGTDKRVCEGDMQPIETAEGDCIFQFSSGSTPEIARILTQTLSGDIAQAGETLTLSAMVRGNKFGEGANLSLILTYADGSTSKHGLTIPSGTYPFTELVQTVALFTDVVGVDLAINVGLVTGRVWLDDFSLTVADTGLLPLPVDSRPGAIDATMPAAPDSFRGGN